MKKKKKKLIDKLLVHPNAILCLSKSLWATEGLMMTNARPKSTQLGIVYFILFFIFKKQIQGDRKSNQIQGERGRGFKKEKRR